jgi:hypothetical protein
VRRALVIAMAVLAGLPASAAATTITPLKPCYVSANKDNREQIPIAAQGLTPNQSATVALDSTVVLPDWQIDPFGSTVPGTIPAPFQPKGQRPFTLTITDNANPANTASVQSLVTALDVHVTPASARPSSRVRFRGRGFTGGPAVYGHYLRKGKLRKTVLLAQTSGPCGLFDVRRRQLPIKHPHTGRWILQIDQSQTWQATPLSAQVLLVIDVSRGTSARAHGSEDPS